MRILLLLILPFLIVLPGCRREVNDARLLRAESLVDDYPDSTLAILDSIGEEGVNGNLNRAAYAMLRGMAMDKANLIPTNDSAMMAAADVFASAGDRRREVISRYYLGRVRYLAGDYPGALLSFFQAKELAEQDSSHFWAGMSCRGIADVYRDTYSAADAELYVRKQYDHLRKSGCRADYLYYTLYDLAASLHQQDKDEEALQLATQLEDTVMKYDAEHLRNGVFHIKGVCYLGMGCYEEAYENYRSYLDVGQADAMDSLHYGLSLVFTDRVGKLDSLLPSLRNVDPRLRSTILWRLYLKKGEYRNALEEKINADTLVDRHFDTRLSNQLNSIVAVYLESREEVAAQRARNARMWTALVVLTAILFFLLVGFLWWQRHKIHRLDMLRLISLQTQLQDDLDHTRTDLDHTRTDLDRIRLELHDSQERLDRANSEATQTREHSLLIRSLMESKLRFLDSLAKTVDDLSHSRVTVSRFRHLIGDIVAASAQGEGNYLEMERCADAVFSNLMKDLRRDLPDMKEEDYRLYLCTVMGLSGGTTAMIIGAPTPDAVYMRKRRLKTKIGLLPAPLRDRYLGLM